MYHVEAESNVDVELLAECGQIAQRLRSLEQSWRIDLKELQKQSLYTFGKPPLATSLSITHKLNDIFDINENSSDVEYSPELISHLRYLEDTVIKIHHQQELLRHTTEHQNRITNAAHKKAYYITKNNMNYSASTENSSSNKSNNNNSNDLTTSSPQATSTTSMAIHEFININAKHESNVNRDNNKSILNNDNNDNDGDDDDDGDDEDDDRNNQKTNCSNKQSQNIYHHQQQLSGRITNDDLQLLLRELKRKVDYTEKMNWLCEYNFFFLGKGFIGGICLCYE